MMFHARAAQFIALASLTVTPVDAFAQVTTIFGNSDPVQGKKWEIAVLADGYTSNAQFSLDASNLIIHDLMADPVYASLAQHFLIRTVYQATTPPSTSLFGITIGGDISNCYIQTQPDTDSKIFAAMQANVPTATHIMVLKNDASTIGCTTHGWTVISSGNVFLSGSLQHEFGHQLAGLHDEYVVEPTTPYPTPPLYGPNCTTDLMNAWWKDMTSVPGFPKLENKPGCHYFGWKIWRPFETCRMRTTTVEFCAVCKGEVIYAATERQFLLSGPNVKTPSSSHAMVDAPRVVRAAYILQPPPPDSSVRVVITLTVAADGLSARGHALTAADVASPATKMYRRTGDYMFEIKEGGVTKETGFLTGDPFEQRAYGTQTSHATAPSRTANVVIAIPGATKADLATRNIQINLYRLRGVAERISGDPATFERFKSNLTLIGSVAVADLREAFQKK
jgi:hypothetical protein